MSSVDRLLEADWIARLERWSRWLRRAHLDGLAGALLDAAEPLSPLGAQLLWIAQPTLGLFAPRDDVASLARLLETPGGLAWLREQLIGPDSGSKDGQ